jgi:hypothetical protein
MTPARLEFEGLTNDQLLDEVRRLALRERVATADLRRCLIEVDTRRLYLREGCASLFTYCTQVLHLAEGAAYNRIEAARAARRFPLVLERIADGGAATVRNIELRCRAHNQYEAVLVFGDGSDAAREQRVVW